jgi:hypothetical protein
VVHIGERFRAEILRLSARPRKLRANANRQKDGAPGSKLTTETRRHGGKESP